MLFHFKCGMVDSDRSEPDLSDETNHHNITLSVKSYDEINC